MQSPLIISGRPPEIKKRHPGLRRHRGTISLRPGDTLFPRAMLRLASRDVRFFGGFEQQSKCVVEAAALLHDLVHAFTDGPAKAQAIKDLEHRGDRLARETFVWLNRRFGIPLDREDIHSLASRLDDVLDEIDAVAAELVVYRVAEPTSECRAFADIIVAAVAATDRAVGSLRTFDPGFQVHAVEVNRLENRADELLRRSLAALFDEVTSPIDVLKWKDIYETMEAVTDRCEDVANVIEGILLKMA